MICAVYRHTDGKVCMQDAGHAGEHFPEVSPIDVILARLRVLLQDVGL